MSEDSKSHRPHWSNWLSIAIAMLAMTATLFEGLVARSNEQMAIFAAFQQEYSSIAAQFPKQLLDDDFRPVPGSDDYRRLEDYWIFAYAEWFATEKNAPLFGSNLWRTYYAGLITDAMNIPSLRSVLQDMMKSDRKSRKDMAEFFATLRKLAVDDGHPLPD